MRYAISLNALMLSVLLSACGGGGAGGGGGTSTNGSSGGNPAPAAGSISLFAGGLGGSGNLDGEGSNSRLTQANALAQAKDGTIYFVDGAIRTVSFDAAGKPVTGTLFRTVTGGPYGDMAIEVNGDLYLAASYSVQRVSRSGAVSTFAGSNDPGYVDGAAADARFGYITGLAFDKTGNLLVSDSASRIRSITPAGVVSTHAATALLDGPPLDLSVNASGDIYIATSGKVIVAAANGNRKSGLAIKNSGGMVADDAGNVYGYENHVLYKATPDGKVSALAGKEGASGFTDGAGDQALLGGGDGIRSFAPRLAIDKAGNVLFSDSYVIRSISPAGVVSTIAGRAQAPGDRDGAGAAARFTSAAWLGMDAAGQIYVSEYQNQLRKVSPEGMVTTMAVPKYDQNGQVLNYFPQGLAYGGFMIAEASNIISRVSDDGKLIPFVSNFGRLIDVARDSNGYFYAVALAVDAAQPSVRRISPGGAVSTIFTVPDNASSDAPSQIAADKDGNLAVTSHGLSPGGGKLYRFNAEGKLLSTTTIKDAVSGLAFDSAGNLYLGTGTSLTLDRISPNGESKVVAGKTGSRGVALGSLPGSLNYSSGMLVTPDGTIYTISEDSLLKIRQ